MDITELEVLYKNAVKKGITQIKLEMTYDEKPRRNDRGFIPVLPGVPGDILRAAPPNYTILVKRRSLGTYLRKMKENVNGECDKNLYKQKIKLAQAIGLLSGAMGALKIISKEDIQQDELIKLIEKVLELLESLDK